MHSSGRECYSRPRVRTADQDEGLDRTSQSGGRPHLPLVRPPKALINVESDVRVETAMPDPVGQEGNSSVRFEGRSTLATVSLNSNEVIHWSPSNVQRISDDEWDDLLAETVEEDRELLERLAED